MRSLRSELIDKGHLQTRTSEADRKSIKASDKPKERLTDRELRELMGENRPTYGRKKGGAFRQR